MVNDIGNKRRRSHRILFLYLGAFIAISGYFLTFITDDGQDKNSGAELSQTGGSGSYKKQQTAAEAQAVKQKPEDIRNNPQLHVKQQQLKVYFNQSVTMLHAKKYELAIVALHQVLEIDPKMPEAHINMGFSLLGMDKPKAARDFFLTALELDDSRLNAFYGLALSHARLSEYQSAIGAIVSFIHLSQDNDPYINNAHKKLQAWRKIVSEAENVTESEG